MAWDHEEESEPGLDADVRDFFGSISHEWMVRFLKHRIAHRRILRLIQKWLRAGVSEDESHNHGAGTSERGAGLWEVREDLGAPEGVNIEKMNAEFVNGVLEITAPVAAVALPRKIEIKAVPMTKQMAA